MDLPFLDQWETPLAQISRLFSTGRIGFFDDLFIQHNEARKVIPTALSVGLAALLGRFDTRVELLVGGVLLGGIVLAIARLARAGRTSVDAALGLAVLYTALAGSARTAYFHLYSITFERLLPELAIVGALALLVGRGLTWGNAVATAALLVGGQYSYPGAIAGWLIVPGFALLAFRRELRTAGRPLLFVVACGVLSSLAYFWGYSRPPDSLPLAAAFVRPWMAWLRFTLRFLGNPLSGSHRIASIAAALALLGYAVAGWIALRRTAGLEQRLVLAWIALGSYSITQALMATVARLPMGLGHAMRGDYVLHASYLYVALAALAILAAPARAERWLVLAMVAISAATFAMLLSPGVRQEFRATREAKLRARACAVAERPDASVCEPENFWLLPSPMVVRYHATRARSAGAW